MDKTVAYIRSHTGGTQAIYIYGDTWLYAAVAGVQQSSINDLLQSLTGSCSSHYFWDAVAANPKQFYTDAAQADVARRRVAPEFVGSKVATICPFWTTSPRHDRDAKDNSPVPLVQWLDAVDYLVDQGYDLLLWPGTGIVDGVRPHIQYVASYNRSPF